MRGASPVGLVGAAASVVGSAVYLFGGFSGKVHHELYRVTLPADFCHAITQRNKCISTSGCSWCQVYNKSGNTSEPTNQSACYPVEKQVPGVCHAQANVTQVTFDNGTRCDVSEFASRDCGTYHSCSACLARFPDAQGIPGKCQWCFGCLTGGKCVTAGAVCKTVHPCPGRNQWTWTESRSCIENHCEATTCASCTSKTSRNCVWTPQLHWIGEAVRRYRTQGHYPWSCFLKSTSESDGVRLAIVSPPQACPALCTRHADCKSCLDSKGGDGGWAECVWSESLGTCFSPSFLPLVCAAGACGRIVRHSSEACPSSCTQASKCSACLGNSSCGWCSRRGFDGDGICMEGAFQGPLYGKCEGNTIDPGPVGTAVNTTRPPLWATTLCPLENECLNGRHTCSPVTERCVDTPESFECVCMPGYAADGPNGKCVPVCEEGCVHGQCVKPNECECSFAWTSPNCSVACQCNGHGQCVDLFHLDECHSCQNNTVGRSCEWCAPLFVGDARHNGTCKTCYEVCNRSADVCMSKTMLNESMANNRSLAPSDVRQWLKHGPRQIVEDGECICLGNSRGVKCKKCVPSYFFLKGVCSRCLCNGHATDCDQRGECSCNNNTVANCQDQQQEDCYKYQCASCRDNFMGTPSDNRQCYRKITVMQEFVIGATYADKPELLPPQRAIFYALYPKFTNVDIRMTIDIFQGEVDVYVTSNKRAFAVYTNETTGAHDVKILQRERNRRDAQPPPEQNVVQLNAAKDRLNTFALYSQQEYALIIRSVSKRLVITFPHSRHELRDTRFYLVFQTRSLHTGSRGVVYFRQDLSQIDLFVFFSVFFSVFFLTMSFCVLVWKLKIYLNQRQIHHEESVQLENRCSRPFATYAFLYGNKDPPRSSLKRGARPQQPRPMKEVVISPLAREPVGDGRAAVLTVMFQMPGNECSEFQLALGSALTLVSGQQTLEIHAGHTQNGHKILTRRSRTITS